MGTRARQTAWLGSLTLLAAGLLVWLGLGLGHPGSHAVRSIGSDEPQSRSLVTDFDAGAASSGVLAGTGARSSDGSERAEAANAAPELAIDLDLEYVVRVVRADTGAPLPFATLRVWPRIQIDWNEYWYQYAAVADVYERTGPGRRDLGCDEQGRAVVPRTKASYGFAARAEGWIGFGGEFEPGEREFKVRCHPDDALDVRVVDAAQQPIQGAWVSLRDRDDDSSSPLWVGCTDAAGRARFEHARAVIDSYGEQMPLALGLAHPFLQLEERRVDPEALPSEPVVLVMPPSCILVVQWVDEQGRDLDPRGSLDLSCDTSRGLESSRGIRTLEECGYDSLPVEHGRLELRCAPCGRRVELSSFPVDGWTEAEQDLGVVLPDQPGERVEKRIVLQAERRRIHGQALDPAGIPIAKAELELRFVDTGDAASRRREPQTVASDQDAGFELAYDGALGPCTLVVGWTTPQRKLFEARAKLPRLEAGVSHDCGTLVLAPVEPLCAGVVVDLHGNPVARAELTVELFDAGRFVPRGSERNFGRQVARAHTSRDGRFVLAGAAVDFAAYAGALEIAQIGAHRQQARANAAMLALTPPRDEPDLDGQFIPLPIGEQDLRLVLSASQNLRGRLQVPPGRSASDYALMAVRQVLAPGEKVGVLHAAPSRDGGADGTGSFEFGQLAAGLWRIEVWDSSYTLEITRVEDLVVGPGASRDPRLDPLVVPAESQRISVELVDAAGRAVIDGAIALLDPARGPDGWSHIVRSSYEPGRYWIWSRRFPVDLEACCAGAAPQRVLGVEADTRIVLQPGLRLEIGVPSLQAGTRLELDCAWVDPDPAAEGLNDEQKVEHARRRSPWGPELDATVGGAAPGPFVVHIPLAGAWRVHGRVVDGEQQLELVDAAGESQWTVEVGGNGVVLDLQVAPRAKTE